MTEDYINSYTTYEAQFSATIIQTDPIILSDTFDVRIDFAWNSSDLAKGNAAFLKIKYFVEDYLHQAIFTHKSATIDMMNVKNKMVVFPFVPTSDIIAMCLHSKLNAIADPHVEVIAVNIGSQITSPKMSYTYSDPTYPALPNLKDWVGTEKYYYDKPWWKRPTVETRDYEVDEKTDLTSPPKFDNILDKIDQLTMGELHIKEEGGEVVDINGWKPKIVKD